jgi:hypothetical protein
VSPLDRVLDRLGSFKKSGSGYVTKCPVHDDQQASLSVGTGADGRVLLKCFAGCTVEQIVSALRLTLADLFPQNGKGESRSHTPPNNTATVQQSLPQGCTLEQYAEAKRLSVTFLKNLGLRNLKYLDRPSIRIPYLNTAGVEVAVQFRLALTKSDDGDNRFRWKSGAKPCLYGLWRLLDARKAGFVVFASIVLPIISFHDPLTYRLLFKELPRIVLYEPLTESPGPFPWKAGGRTLPMMVLPAIVR